MPILCSLCPSFPSSSMFFEQWAYVVCFSPKSRKIGNKCVNSPQCNTLHPEDFSYVTFDFLRNQENIGELNMAKENNFSTFAICICTQSIFCGNKAETITLAQNQ